MYIPAYNDNSLLSSPTSFPGDGSEYEYGRDSRYRTVQPWDLDSNYLQQPKGMPPPCYQPEPDEQCFFEELGLQLNNCLDGMELSSPVNWNKIENALDRTLNVLSEMQDPLQELYPDAGDRARLLGNYLQLWQEKMAAFLAESTLSDREQQAICSHFDTCLSVLVTSMMDYSAAAVTPVDLPCFGNPTPEPDELEPFYLEPQQGAQCGRHAANMFFGSHVIQENPDCEEISCDRLFNKMRDRDPFADTEAPLAMYDMGLMAYHAKGNRACYQRGLMPDALDQLPGDFVLATGGHYVCFKKDDKKQWHLLDSLNCSPTKITPSAYLRQIFDDLNGNQYSEANINGRISVICRQVPNELAGFVKTAWANTTGVYPDSASDRETAGRTNKDALK